jgi:hypothetical protein
MGYLLPGFHGNRGCSVKATPCAFGQIVFGAWKCHKPKLENWGIHRREKLHCVIMS